MILNIRWTISIAACVGSIIGEEVIGDVEARVDGIRRGVPHSSPLMVQPDYASLMFDKQVGVVGIVARVVGAAGKRGKIFIHAGWPI